MQRLRHPETGETVHASRATAARLCDEGWVDLAAPASAADETPAGDDERERPAKNASRETWDEYAESLGLDPEDFSSKDDLIAAVDAAESKD